MSCCVKMEILPAPEAPPPAEDPEPTELVWPEPFDSIVPLLIRYFVKMMREPPVPEGRVVLLEEFLCEVPDGLPMPPPPILLPVPESLPWPYPPEPPWIEAFPAVTVPEYILAPPPPEPPEKEVPCDPVPACDVAA